MRKYKVEYTIQYMGQTIVDTEEVEAYSKEEAEGDVAERIRDNLQVFTTAEEEEEDE